MRVSRAKSVENKELVLDTAAKLFREHGFDGIGVADLMKNAGLTVGGFYKSFESKEDLVAQACQRACDKTLKRWEEHISNPDIKDPLSRIANSYLSTQNRDELATTCVLSTLANEVPRHDDAVKKVFEEGVESTIALLSKIIPGETVEEQRANAITTFSQWLGALILARAAGTGELSEEILEVSKNAQIQRNNPQH
ncbi:MULTISPECIES: TetR/AcrR family transcriptional regulator [Methylotenera]|uniref:TetR/AcrR family transcriptional regulator n=1 Tax=Methylotenera TaxID=359407 RepID=UPI0003681626|nr:MULTISPECIES: TetR/AcrR family transcriptional regulator [Methylotenera]